MDRKIKKKRWTPKRIVLLVIASAFLLLITYWTVFGDRSKRYNVSISKIAVSSVERGLFNEYIPVIGTVIPIKTVYLDALQGGRVEKIFIEAGNIVKKGEKLLQLANTDLRLTIMNKETELDNLINDLRSRKLSMEKDELGLRREIMEMDFQIKRAKQVYEKNIRMIDKGGISRQEFDKSKDEYELYQSRREFASENYKLDSLSRNEQIRQMEGAVKRMEENIKISRTKLENLIIRAPISGNLTSFNAEIGELKSQGQRFGQIDVVDAFKVRAKIDEHYIARINNGLQ
ncbi:efflux transporter periplasmic adaptor subunit, partial [bacterium]|nr:efflux transporter periplasmic adaptor subunit [bacterium]